MRNLIAVLVVLIGASAFAHFRLTSPPSYAAQDTLGNPQKSAPCGQADPANAAVPNGIVTTVQQGSTLSITINETIAHPGHYRVSIAQDQAALPADPVVTAGSTACGSTVIVTNPVLPLLADGKLVHTSAFSTPQTFTVPLPAGLTCTNCVLQVSEFMSNHGLNNPGGCFYHHCAGITIAAPDAGTGGGAGGGAGGGSAGGAGGSAGGAAGGAGGGSAGGTGGSAGGTGGSAGDAGKTDGGTAGGTGGAGGSGGGAMTGGCGCLAGSTSGSGAIALIAIGLLLRARRRRAE